MSDILLAIILGVVEGLTEFIPVSSTAHIRIVQAALGVDLNNEFWKMFSVVIQLGAILSVFFYFNKRIHFFVLDFWRSKNKVRHPVTYVLVSFVITAVPAFLMSKIIGDNLESLKIMGWALLLGGIIMIAVDKKLGLKGKTERIEDMNLKQSVGIGVIQILSAVFPGTSRSMSTIVGGQIFGFNRTAALEYSFFLSIPTMIAATMYDLLKFLKTNSQESIDFNFSNAMTLGTGFLVSFFVALVVIAWFMNWVRKKDFIIFAIYRLVIGSVVLLYFV